MGKSRKKPAAKNQKTGRKGWTTEEHFEYLTSLIPNFVSAQSSKTTADTWPAIYEEWFRHWPLAPPTTKETDEGCTEEDRVKAMKTVSTVFYFFSRA